MYQTYGNQQTDWLHLAGDTMLNREPNMNLAHKWEYEDGLMLSGVYQIFLKTGEQKYLDYIKSNIDAYLDDAGHIDGYHFDEFNLDHINNGKILLDLFAETHDQKYKLAADQLYQQLLAQPRTPEGTFWHKKIYPNQVWLDGLYMGSVFYGRYLAQFKPEIGFEDVAHQFISAYNVTLDAQSGLCYHAYDAKKIQPWANPETGHSPHFWTRSIGWFVMSMVDVLEYIPETDSQRTTILKHLNDLLAALKAVADQKTHLWYQITDEADRPMNYLESSGSLMILTAIAKAIRLNYISKDDWRPFLMTGYDNALKEFISVTNQNNVNVNKIAHVGGLGGPNKRDGSFAYYISEPIVTNDHKGVGPFLLLICEMQSYLK